MKTHISMWMAAALATASLAAAEETTTVTVPVVYASLDYVSAVNVTVDDEDSSQYDYNEVTIYDASTSTLASNAQTVDPTPENGGTFTVEEATGSGYLAESEEVWAADSGDRPVQLTTTVSLSLDLETLVDALNNGYISGSISLLNIDYVFTNNVAEETGVSAEAYVGLCLYTSGDNSDYQLAFQNPSSSTAAVWSSSTYSPLTLISYSDGTYSIASDILEYLEDDGTISITFHQENSSTENDGPGTTVTVTIGDSTDTSLSSTSYSSRYNTALASVTLATTCYYTETYTIPEPTTATLSLLALAGLAARRRRK